MNEMTRAFDREQVERRGETCLTSGRAGMSGAVERQQLMLAETIAAKRLEAETARNGRLDRYLGLLANPLELSDQLVADEFSGLVQEFYLPRNIEEECRIIDAGGITYGF